MDKTNATFNQWEAAVDNLIISKFGLGMHDFPDYCWRDQYDSEVTAEEAVTEWMNDDQYGPMASF